MVHELRYILASAGYSEFEDEEDNLIYQKGKVQFISYIEENYKKIYLQIRDEHLEVKGVQPLINFIKNGTL